jgi:hypothetical protein
MSRRFLSPELIARVQQLVDEGVSNKRIARRLKVTPYIVRILARAPRGERNVPPSHAAQQAGRRFARAYTAVSVVLVRQIQRMLQAKWLNYDEIAREAGVCSNVVARIDAGRLSRTQFVQPVLSRGETWVPELTRCPDCGAQINVVPCRVCALQRRCQNVT